MTKTNLRSLAAFVSKVMREKSLSGYEVQRLSNNAISQSYINRIKNGAIAAPSVLKLEALARGLREPVSAVVEAAGLSQPTETQLTHERLLAIEEVYAHLDSVQKENVEYLFRVIERELTGLSELREEVQNEDLER